MTDQQKTFYWIVLGIRAYHLMEQGKYATAAKLMRWGLSEGIFEPDEPDGSSWRTSILMHYDWSKL